MCFRVAVALLVGAVGFLPVAAETALEPPPLERYLRWGPVRIRPGVSVTSLGYDDNVFYRTGTDPRVGDFAITAGPRADGVLLFGRRAFTTFSAKLDYTAYRRYSEINYANVFTQTRTVVPFRRFGVYVDLGRDRTQDRPLDLQDARPVRTEARVGYGVVANLGWRTDLEAGWFTSRWRNRDPNFLSCGTGTCFTIGDLLDRDEDGVRVKARYLAFGRTRFTLTWQDKTADFLDDDPAIARDSGETRIVPGIEFGEGGRLTGAVRVGHARLDLKRTGNVDYSGRVSEGRIAYRLGAGTTVSASALRDVSFAIYEGNSIYLRTAYEARALKYFTRALGGEIGTSWGRVTFPAGTRRDRTTSTDVGLRVRFSENDLGRRIEYVVRWARYRIDSNVPSLDQSRATFGIGATIGY